MKETMNRVTNPLIDLIACASARLAKETQNHKRGLAMVGVVCLVFWLVATVNGLAAEPAPPLTVTSIDDTDALALWRSGSGWHDFSGLGKTHYKGTAMSSQQPGDLFVCGNTACTRIRWFATKSTDRGIADVYVDGVLKQTIDLYAPRLQESHAVFDTGVMPLGPHKLRVVVKAGRNAAATGSWVECDKIEVTHDITKSKHTVSAGPSFVAPYDRKVLYFGKWEDGKLPSAEAVCQSDRPCAACVLVFKGPAVCWLGGKGPDHGLADVYIDQQLVQTVDAYSPAAAVSQVLFEKTGLSTQRMHTLRIEVRRERSPKATGNVQQIHGFEVSEALDYPKIIRRTAEAELKAIAAGTKPYLAPETWKPVAYAATAPAKGVTLESGLLRDCFDRNIAYLNHCFVAPNGTYCDSKKIEGFWLVDLPGSSEGRMLGGAGHTLRWGERAEMRAIVDTFVNRVKNRQTSDGWCLPYPIADITKSERSNYDRVVLTRGLIAAGMVGNSDAYGILRRFYDWFNPSPYQAMLLRGSNCNNGHEGGLLMYFSPAGKKEDLVAVERYFVQDFFLEQAANAEPLALDYYPLHTPHSYVILAFQAWLDHYRATGAAKYLDAAKGAWQIVNESYEHIGGIMAICEEPAGAYPPKSYYLGKHTGETCGSVFWADFNHRFLQLFPAEAKYADKIENVIYNVILACQDPKGSIRYHNNLHGSKEGPQCINTCCEVMGVPFIAKLPQYVYSVADDGLYVNLFAASTITWFHAGQLVTLKTETAYPYNGKVAIKLTTPAPTRMKLRIRIPSWVNGKVAINVNGAVAANGTPGSYAQIERSWSNNDAINLEFPMAFRVVKYTGLDQDAHNDRYALLYGPVLMALLGGSDLDLPSNELPNRLLPIAGNPLHFGVAKHPGCTYLPYWQVQAEKFTCFPTMRNPDGTGPIDGRH